ncbi:MAG: hypothetical protein OXC81_06045, partial [Betaproteobacteria bacterium]|nr:hypothetical protein [Betaproteobacteria bacterium]
MQIYALSLEFSMYKKRDLDAYARDYLPHSKGYDEFMVKARHEMSLQQMRKYPHSHVLEVGCALHPIFLECADFKSMTVVEPASMFFANARKCLRKIPKARAAKI